MIEEKAQLIDGKAVAQKVKDELKLEIDKLKQNPSTRLPGLAVILVGDDAASHRYVAMKEKSCESVGIDSFKTILPSNTNKEELMAVINVYNQDSKVDGILLQLPLPKALRPFTQEIVDSISPNKDVDGLTTENLGRLLTFSDKTIFPCTPKGCMRLLEEIDYEISGKKALVIGRSELVGKPIALMLNKANATVTMAHSRTQDLEAEIAQADILVAAIGQPLFVKGDCIKDAAVIIDVGINAIEADGKRKLVGDVDFESALKKASYITPVPGGVGPMTVAMLLSNCYQLYQQVES